MERMIDAPKRKGTPGWNTEKPLNRRALATVDSYSNRLGVHATGTQKIVLNGVETVVRQTHCWKCKAYLDSNVARVCPICHWLKCWCGACSACGCNFPRNAPATFAGKK